ncbi:antirestriction protein ArdC [Variovorax guangxiensis]|nr:antirestriction protein ArdC [Variovorax guangxiensis]
MDVRQVITDRIIAMLEKGGHEFRERWTRAASRGMPRNGRTGQAYHGANVLLLWDAAIEQGYASNVWLTYKQASSLRAQVRQGERAVMCAHFERQARQLHEGNGAVCMPEVEEEGRAEASSRDSVLLVRPFWVFNVAQIDGLPGEVVDLCIDPVKAPGGPVEGALRLLGGCDAAIRHGFDHAMYLPELDEIRLPWPSRFTSGEAYCATLLHELVLDGTSQSTPSTVRETIRRCGLCVRGTGGRTRLGVRDGALRPGRRDDRRACRLPGQLAAAAEERSHRDLHGRTARGRSVRVHPGPGDAAAGLRAAAVIG